MRYEIIDWNGIKHEVNATSPVGALALLYTRMRDKKPWVANGGTWENFIANIMRRAGCKVVYNEDTTVPVPVNVLKKILNSSKGRKDVKYDEFVALNKLYDAVKDYHDEL